MVQAGTENARRRYSSSRRRRHTGAEKNARVVLVNRQAEVRQNVQSEERAGSRRCR